MTTPSPMSHSERLACLVHAMVEAMPCAACCVITALHLAARFADFVKRRPPQHSLQLWGDAIAQDINKTGNQDELYAHISARLLRKTLQQQDLERHLESYCKNKQLCFIVDEMQAIVDLNCNVTANFFDWLAKNEIPYVATGTFKSRELNWRQSSDSGNHLLDASSPFNRVQFYALEPLSTLQIS
ncbi:hypothetical protein V8E54_012456 [Elaphomyces granulatus]